VQWLFFAVVRALAVAYALRLGIVHGALKLPNILPEAIDAQLAATEPPGTLVRPRYSLARARAH
jgi:hypothetical protein